MKMNKDQLILFFTKVLNDLNCPVTKNNLDFLLLWAKFEGTKAKFNPLATTYKDNFITDKYSKFNYANVKNYLDFNTGVYATVKTLNLSYYKSIINNLKNDKELSYYSSFNVLKSLKTWGTSNLVAFLKKKSNIISENKKKEALAEMPIFLIGVLLLLFLKK